MHPSILARRKAQAVARITEAVARLDPTRAQDLKPKGIKDASTADMMFLENVADLIDQYFPAPAEDPGVTAVTEPHPLAEPGDIPIDGEPNVQEFPLEELPEEAPRPARKPARRPKKSSSTG